MTDKITKFGNRSYEERLELLKMASSEIWGMIQVCKVLKFDTDSIFGFRLQNPKVITIQVLLSTEHQKIFFQSNEELRIFRIGLDCQKKSSVVVWLIFFKNRLHCYKQQISFWIICGLFRLGV